ncbi:28172_t:CDS:1, partial [Racocetra persica]
GEKGSLRTGFGNVFKLSSPPLLQAFSRYLIIYRIQALNYTRAKSR